MIRTNRNAKLTGAQKGRIIPLYFDHGHSIVDIANIMETTEVTVRKWIRRFTEFDNVDRIKPPGANRRTTREQDHDLVQYLRENPFSTATRAAALHGVSYNIARLRIKESELNCRMAASEIELSDTHRNQRVRFAQYTVAST